MNRLPTADNQSDIQRRDTVDGSNDSMIIPNMHTQNDHGLSNAL